MDILSKFLLFVKNKIHVGARKFGHRAASFAHCPTLGSHPRKVGYVHGPRSSRPWATEHSAAFVRGRGRFLPPRRSLPACGGRPLCAHPFCSVVGPCPVFVALFQKPGAVAPFAFSINEMVWKRVGRLLHRSPSPNQAHVLRDLIQSEAQWWISAQGGRFLYTKSVNNVTVVLRSLLLFLPSFFLARHGPANTTRTRQLSCPPRKLRPASPAQAEVVQG